MSISNTRARADYAPACSGGNESGPGLLRVGLAGIFRACSIQLTRSMRSKNFVPCSSILNAAPISFDSNSMNLSSSKTRISAMRWSKLAIFMSNGPRKLRMSWICLRISSKVSCIPAYKPAFSPPPSLFIQLIWLVGSLLNDIEMSIIISSPFGGFEPRIMNNYLCGSECEEASVCGGTRFSENLAHDCLSRLRLLSRCWDSTKRPVRSASFSCLASAIACLNRPTISLIHSTLNGQRHAGSTGIAIYRASISLHPVVYVPAFCRGSISGLILSSYAGDGDGFVPGRGGLGEIFSNSSINLTRSRRSPIFSPCSSILDSARPTLCSKNKRVAAIRSSRFTNFMSNGVRKLRISWICFRISSNVSCISVYKNDCSFPPPPCLVVSVNHDHILTASKCQINICGSAICNTYVSREDREVRRILDRMNRMKRDPIPPTRRAIASERRRVH